MFRSFIIAAAAVALSSAAASAGGLQTLAQGGQAPEQLHGFWSQSPREQEYQPPQGVRCVYRVCFYKQTWKRKVCQVFPTFKQAKVAMLRSKLQGYYADLTIHELHAKPKRGDYWLP